MASTLHPLVVIHQRKFYLRLITALEDLAQTGTTADVRATAAIEAVEVKARLAMLHRGIES